MWDWDSLLDFYTGWMATLDVKQSVLFQMQGLLDDGEWETGLGALFKRILSCPDVGLATRAQVSNEIEL